MNSHRIPDPVFKEVDPCKEELMEHLQEQSEESLSQMFEAIRLEIKQDKESKKMSLEKEEREYIIQNKKSISSDITGWGYLANNIESIRILHRRKEDAHDYAITITLKGHFSFNLFSDEIKLSNFNMNIISSCYKAGRNETSFEIVIDKDILDKKAKVEAFLLSIAPNLYKRGLDLNKKIEMYNQGIERFFGYKDKELRKYDEIGEQTEQQVERHKKQKIEQGSALAQQPVQGFQFSEPVSQQRINFIEEAFLPREKQKQKQKRPLNDQGEEGAPPCKKRNNF